MSGVVEGVSGATRGDATPSLGVVVCAYTFERLDLLRDCLTAAGRQLRPGDELVVVVDYNPALATRLRAESGHLRILENTYDRGLSGARSTGAEALDTDVLAFLDDDAVPQPGWAAAIRARLVDLEAIGVAGAVEPELDGERLPRWFPAEFGWVIGCDYRGLPAHGQPVRNPIGANMAVRRAVLEEVGGFDPGLGRIGTLPVGCEETELFIRIRSRRPDALVIRDTKARVRHHVPPARRTVRYFVRRCWHEGRSKAALVARTGKQAGLSAERRQLRVLAGAVLRELKGLPYAAPGGLSRALMIVIGTLATGLGYLTAPRTPSRQNFWSLVHLRGGPMPETPEGAAELSRSGPDVSLVVCTLGRSEHLEATVASLLAQRWESDTTAELIVVDNDPRAGLARERLAHLSEQIVLVDQPQRGLSAARNAGLAVARGRVIAFTDDDAIADPDWASQLLAVFREPTATAVGCVTGLVEPAETDSDTARWFEEYGGFGKGAERLVWSAKGEGAESSLGRPGPRGVAFPCSGGEFGSGNNMAFRTDLLRRLGGFDVALGAGSESLGGEDLDIFRRVFTAGSSIVYQPAAVIRHHHRGSYPELISQLFAYGAGMAAVITKQLVSGPRSAAAVLVRLAPALVLLLDPGSVKNRGKSDSFPAELTRAELRGYLAGPFRYLRARCVSSHQPAASSFPPPAASSFPPPATSSFPPPAASSFPPPAPGGSAPS